MRRSHYLLLALFAAGCQPLDPLERAHTWMPTGSNEANLRVMVANPADLDHGVDQPGVPSAEAAPPITKLFAGRRARLPMSNAAQIGAVNQLPPNQPPAPVPGQPQ